MGKESDDTVGRQTGLMMNGLRIYITPSAAETLDGGDEFYSRRLDGPYYRWWYEERAGRWRSARMHEFSPHELSVSAWTTVPSDLQRSLVNHYED
jgi:hypothetical protein